MSIFRRLFGKTSDEFPAAPVAIPDAGPPEGSLPAKPEPTPSLPSEAAQEIDELDPTTRPLGTELPPAPHGASPAVSAFVTQPLPPDAAISRRATPVSFGLVSDVGLVRTNNQDAAVSLFSRNCSVDEYPDFGLFVVADGMGGHIEGEKASAIVARVLATHVAKHIYLPLFAPDNEGYRVPFTELLSEAIQKANGEVIKHVPKGGTTATAVVIIGDLIHIAHVGDSRAYLITEDGVEQLTRDHSLVQRLIELDQLTPEEAVSHPQKNVLYRALGQTESLEVDVMTRRMPANSRLLICSDGLWGLIEEHDIFDISMNTANPQQACEKLVALANTHGGIDNITAILLNIE